MTPFSISVSRPNFCRIVLLSEEADIDEAKYAAEIIALGCRELTAKTAKSSIKGEMLLPVELDEKLLRKVASKAARFNSDILTVMSSGLALALAMGLDEELKSRALLVY